MTEPLKFQPEFLVASGLRVLPGVTGIVFDNVGIIKIHEGTNRKGVDASLLRALKAAVDVLKIQVGIASVDTGKHTSQSRHYTGRAVDISRIGKPGTAWEPVTPRHPLAIRLADWLLEQGFGPGERRNGQSIPGLIFGPPTCRWNVGVEGHMDHIHLSVVLRKARP